MSRKMTQAAFERLVKTKVSKRAETPVGDEWRGLYLVRQPSGHFAFALRYRNADGKTRKQTLEATTLKEARKEAEHWRGRIAKGEDPAAPAPRQQAAQPEVESEVDSVNAMLDKFAAR